MPHSSGILKSPICNLTTETPGLCVTNTPREHPQWPEFLRLPAPGERCPVTGLSRGALNALILGTNPPVRSACLRRKGATRGIRLIEAASLLQYIRANIEGHTTSPKAGENPSRTK